jgi:predicted ribosome quality control (RQC) complex YloA/Tae2 family protein
MKTEIRHIPALNGEIQFIVGTDAQDNFDIIDASEPTDMWFHLSGHSSCHVIAKMPHDIALDKKQKLQIIKQGALICKQNSKRKSEQNVDVIYTTVSNITKTKIIGQVETTNVKHIDI